MLKSSFRNYAILLCAFGTTSPAWAESFEACMELRATRLMKAGPEQFDVRPVDVSKCAPTFKPAPVPAVVQSYRAQTNDPKMCPWPYQPSSLQQNPSGQDCFMWSASIGSGMNGCARAVRMKDGSTSDNSKNGTIPDDAYKNYVISMLIQKNDMGRCRFKKAGDPAADLRNKAKP